MVSKSVKDIWHKQKKILAWILHKSDKNFDYFLEIQEILDFRGSSGETEVRESQIRENPGQWGKSTVLYFCDPTYYLFFTGCLLWSPYNSK